MARFHFHVLLLLLLHFSTRGLAADVVTAETTTGGPAPARIEVTQVAIGPDDSKDTAQSVARAAIAANPGAKVGFVCVSGAGAGAAQCDKESRELGSERDPNYTSASIRHDELPETGLLPPGATPPEVSADASRAKAGVRSLREIVTVVRVAMSGTVGLLVGHFQMHADWGPSAVIGLTAAALSGAWAYHELKLDNWRSHQSPFYWSDKPPPKERTAGEAKQLFKRTILSSLYYGGVAAARAVHGIATSASGALTGIGLSVFSQYPWDKAIQEQRAEATARHPENEVHYANRAYLAKLALATVAVTGSMAALGDVRLGLGISLTAGVLGHVYRKWKWIPEPIRRPIEALGRFTCRAFSLLGRVFGGRAPPAGRP